MSECLLEYRGPAQFKLSPASGAYRDRNFLPFAQRQTGFESDLHSLREMLRHWVPRQQANGCFLSPELLDQPDRTDDHLGVAGLLSYYLTVVPAKPEWEEALRGAVSYQLNHLVWKLPSGRGWYVRFRLTEDTPLDWCNTLWVLQSVNYLLKYARPFLGESLYAQLQTLGAELWTYLSGYRQRDENPCHNQLLEYTALGYSYGKATGRDEVCAALLDYYHGTLRRLRVQDRGRWIYTEFNRWCAHYALLSWSALEHLRVESGDPIFDQDALQMAAAFNDRVSAGGYTYGGSRRDEPGYEEFLYPLWYREKQFGFGRVLLSEPSNQWRKLLFDGHNGRALVGRMPLYAMGRPEEPASVEPSISTLLRGTCSVSFNADTTPHLISVNGLEMLEANNPLKAGGGLAWLSNYVWKKDELIAHPPVNSSLHRYGDARRLETNSLTVHASMQRGSHWEIRHWWISDGQMVGRFSHLLSHNCLETEELILILGNPYLACYGGSIHPLRQLRMGEKVISIQAGPQRLQTEGAMFLSDCSIVSTHALRFVRSSAEAFDGFPTRNGQPWGEQGESNRIEVVLSESKHRFAFRESVFTALQIGGAPLPPEVSSSPQSWECRLLLGIFSAVERSGVWEYELRNPQGTLSLPSPGFGQLVNFQE